MGLAHEKKSYLQEKANLFEIGSGEKANLFEIGSSTTISSRSAESAQPISESSS